VSWFVAWEGKKNFAICIICDADYSIMSFYFLLEKKICIRYCIPVFSWVASSNTFIFVWKQNKWGRFLKISHILQINICFFVLETMQFQTKFYSLNFQCNEVFKVIDQIFKDSILSITLQSLMLNKKGRSLCNSLVFLDLGWMANF
jgi:hypothetical protein